MSNSYKIRLKNCSFFAYHGLFSSEKEQGQRFFVDAVLEVQPDRPLSDDDMSGTVDYGAVFSKIESCVCSKRFNLIEALAEDIAIEILNEFPMVLSADITVRKPSVPIQGILDFAEVSVSLQANDARALKSTAFAQDGKSV